MTGLKQCDYCHRWVRKNISPAAGGTKRICIQCKVNLAARQKQRVGRRYEAPKRKGGFRFG